MNGVAEMVHAWCELPSSQPNKPVLYPGQPELIEKEYRLKHGVPVGLNLLDEFRQLALKYHLPEEAWANLKNSHLTQGFHAQSTFASSDQADSFTTDSR